jgi:predicted DNA-binding transcriptional regulator YafY
MTRSARLLEILITLQTRPRFTVAELAAEFAVSRRTMLRDLHALSAMGVPLAAVPGPHGGYSLIRSRRLLPLALSVDEAIAVLLSYEAFLQYAQSPFTDESLSAMTKLRNAIPADVIKEIDRVRRHVAVVEPVRSYEAPLLAELLRASVEGAHLRVVYESRFGVSERLIYPLGVVAEHGFWYCVSYDYRRRGILSLRADRFRSVERAEGEEIPATLSLRDWLETRWQDAEDPVLLRARVTRAGAAHYEVGALFGTVEIGEDGQGVVETTIPASEVDYFAARLLTVGAELTVESPPELIQAIRQKAAALLALYREAG